MTQECKIYDIKKIDRCYFIPDTTIKPLWKNFLYANTVIENIYHLISTTIIFLEKHGCYLVMLNSIYSFYMS